MHTKPYHDPNSGGGQGRNGPGPSNFSDPLKPEWLTQEFNEEARAWAEEFAKHLAENKYTTSQLRKFFGAFKRLQMEQDGNLKLGVLLLIPKAAYAAGRENDFKKKIIAKEFHDKMNKAIQVVTAEDNPAEVRQRFERFVYLLEAIVAYHKYHGGKDS